MRPQRTAGCAEAAFACFVGRPGGVGGSMRAARCATTIARHEGLAFQGGVFRVQQPLSNSHCPIKRQSLTDLMGFALLRLAHRKAHRVISKTVDNGSVRAPLWRKGRLPVPRENRRQSERQWRVIIGSHTRAIGRHVGVELRGRHPISPGLIVHLTGLLTTSLRRCSALPRPRRRRRSRSC